ncbi:MAG TPA: Ig-like domain-containing protein, partial [Nannocystis sp.]
MSTASTASEASASEASTSEASTSEGSGPGSSTAPPPTTGGTSSDESTDTGAPTSSGAPGFCGDGTVDDGEECDDGPNNGPDGPCNSDCTHGCPTSTPLAVLARTPAGEGVAAPTDAALTLTFTCAIDRDTVTEDTVFVHGSQTGRRKFTVTWDGTTATLEFARPLLPAERIDVTLTSGIRDLMGNALKPQVFHFTVSGAPSSGTYVADSTDIGTWMYGAVGDLDGDGDVDIARADGYVYYN